MSRDIFVQDIPDGVASVEDIPYDWNPSTLPVGHTEVVAPFENWLRKLIFPTLNGFTSCYRARTSR